MIQFNITGERDQVDTLGGKLEIRTSYCYVSAIRQIYKREAV